MKYLVFIAALGILGPQIANAGANLVVKEPLKIQLKKGDLVLQAGQYAAKLDIDSDEIEIDLVIGGKKRNFEFKTPKNKDQVYDLQKLQVKAADLKQEFNLSGQQFHTSKDIGGAKIANRSCVISSWTTQENCRIVESWVPGTGCSILDGECMWPGHSEQSISCDTVTHSISGLQDVTFVPVFSHSKSWINFVDADSGKILAELILSEDKYETERRISQTACKM